MRNISVNSKSTCYLFEAFIFEKLTKVRLITHVQAIGNFFRLGKRLPLGHRRDEIQYKRFTLTLNKTFIKQNEAHGLIIITNIVINT